MFDDGKSKFLKILLSSILLKLIEENCLEDEMFTIKSKHY